MLNKGCHSCRWDYSGYCEKPGGSNCNWVGEMFRGEPNSWSSWEPKVERPPLKISKTLYKIAEILEKQGQ